MDKKAWRKKFADLTDKIDRETAIYWRLRDDDEAESRLSEQYAYIQELQDERESVLNTIQDLNLKGL